MPSSADLTPAASLLSTERIVATLADGSTVGVLASGLPVSTAQAAADTAVSAASLQKSANLSDLASAATARTNLGLGNVDNTSDAAKPISTLTAAALDAKAADDLSNAEAQSALDATLATDALAVAANLYACWGDSLTAGQASTTAWPTYFGLSTGYFPGVFNGGVGGETSTQIKARMVAATARYDSNVVIWAGRNNYMFGSTVLADIAEMVAALPHDRYLVMGIPAGQYADEHIGGANRDELDALNASLATTYGPRFVPIHTYLQSEQALTDAGITPTGQDATDLADGIVPASLRVDLIHLTPTGYQLVAAQVLAAMATAWGPELGEVVTLRALVRLLAAGGIGTKSLSVRAEGNFSALEIYPSSAAQVGGGVMFRKVDGTEFIRAGVRDLLGAEQAYLSWIFRQSGGTRVAAGNMSETLLTWARFQFSGDGSASAPATRFVTDQQTGVYRKSAGVYAIACAGSEVFAFSAAGNTTSRDMEVTDATKGLILRDTNGVRYRVTVSPAGALVVTAL